MKTISLPSGQTIAALGMGTWCMSESPSQRQREVAALRHGIDLGMPLIDTAEMYGEGGAEAVVGEAIAPNRPSVFLVSKVYFTKPSGMWLNTTQAKTQVQHQLLRPLSPLLRSGQKTSPYDDDLQTGVVRD